MGRRYGRAARAATAGALTALAAAACSSVTGTTTTTSAGLSGPTGTPVTIGISLPLTGDFAADGLASEKGYQLWASDVNAAGGMLGRPVKLKIVNDNSDPNQTAKDYTTLITQDHVDLTLAPFSSLLTKAAVPVTTSHGYALVAGSAGAPSVYALNSHDFFSTTVPVDLQMVPFANWVKTLPAGQRPKNAAYAMVDDPFADPPVLATRNILQQAGIATAYAPAPYNANSTAGQLAKDATAVANSKADLVVLGSVDVPTVSTFINTFARLGYQPKMFIAAAGPDQGQAFLNAVGTATANGVMVPNGWYGGFPNALSHVMVQNYIAKFGGTVSDVNADVAEAYSAGQTLAAGVSGAGSIDNLKVIAWLHGNRTVETVSGPVKFDETGKNLAALNSALIFQWQPGGHFLQVLPKGLPGSAPIIATKPAW